MKDNLVKTSVGIAALITSVFAVPVVPEDMELSHSYQYPTTSERIWIEDVATTTNGVESIVQVKTVLPDSEFIDEDGNGVISVSVFKDKAGNYVYVKIPDAKYSEMGKVGGYQKNPQKTEYKTIFETITPKVDAAIAIDATSAGFNAAGTSLTFAHTNTGSNLAIACGIFSFGSGDTSTGVTYNGVTVQQRGKQAADASGYQYFYAATTSATGANNVVMSHSSSVQIFGTCASYTGVSQSAPFPDAAITSIKTGTTISLPATSVTVDQSWLVASGRSPSNAPTASAGTIVRKTNPTSGDAAWILDSNGARSTGANSLDYTQIGSVNNYNTIIAIAPAAAAPSITPNQNFIPFE